MNVIPTVQAAVQMFSGTLTPEQTFGRDPLAPHVSKTDVVRQRDFKKYFPSFVVLFNEIANANCTFFQDAILYYLRLTNYFSPIGNLIIHLQLCLMRIYIINFRVCTPIEQTPSVIIELLLW